MTASANGPERVGVALGDDARQIRIVDRTELVRVHLVRDNVVDRRNVLDNMPRTARVSAPGADPRQVDPVSLTPQ